MYVYMYISVARRACAMLAAMRRDVFSHVGFINCVYCLLQKCTSKGIRRRGTVLKHRNSLQRRLCPVVICPYL